MSNFFYRLAFAIVDWCEATVCLLTLGMWSPPWAIRFAAWATFRKRRLKVALERLKSKQTIQSSQTNNEGSAP